MLTIPSELEELGVCFVSGSRVICNPPVLNTDLDIIMYVPEESRYLVLYNLQTLGYEESCAYIAATSDWCSMVKGDTNVILVFTVELYEAWGYATQVATRLNVTTKEDRASLFTIIKNYYKKV